MKPLFRNVLAGLPLLASAAAWAGVTVAYVKPEEFSDLAFTPIERERALQKFSEYFATLAPKLPAGQDLHIEVLDIDRAGRMEPSRRGLDEIRLLTGGADWPHMRLRYTVQSGGQVVGSGESEISNMSYLMRQNRYSSGDSLRYEKQMLDDWFDKTILAQGK